MMNPKFFEPDLFSFISLSPAVIYLYFYIVLSINLQPSSLLIFVCSFSYFHCFYIGGVLYIFYTPSHPSSSLFSHPLSLFSIIHFPIFQLLPVPSLILPSFYTPLVSFPSPSHILIPSPVPLLCSLHWYNDVHYTTVDDPGPVQC